LGVTYGITDIKDQTKCFSNTDAPNVIWYKNTCSKVTSWCISGCTLSSDNIAASALDVQINFGTLTATQKYQPLSYLV
jgi:hypothetical protein